MLSITNIIIVITAIVSIMAFQNRSLMGRWIFEPARIKQYNQYYRFITSGFLHADWLHLIINMWVLYMFGNMTENYFIQIHGKLGIYYYILLYFAAIAISSIKTYIQEADNYHYMSLGASGAVAAVLFASIIFEPWRPVYLYGILELPGILFAVAYVAYSHYMSRQRVDNINHDAHLYGALFGFVFTMLLKPQLAIYFFNSLINPS